MLGVAALFCLAISTVLSHPFNLAHFHQLEKLAKLNAAPNPYTVPAQQPFGNNQFKPAFNPHYQYNPQDYLADPLGSFPVSFYLRQLKGSGDLLFFLGLYSCRTVVFEGADEPNLEPFITVEKVRSFLRASACALARKVCSPNRLSVGRT